MKKKTVRMTSLVLSKKTVEKINVESECQGITKTKFILNLLVEYFESKEKKELPSVVINDKEKVKISIRLLETYAKRLHMETFKLRLSKNAFVEALITDYFTRKKL